MLRVPCPFVIPTGHAAFVDHIAINGGQRHITPFDDASGFVDDIVARQQVQAVACFDQPAVGHVVGGLGRQVVGGPQGAGVNQVFAGNQVQVVTRDQGSGGCKTVVGLGQIQHRHQDFFTVHFVLFQPHDVMRQRRDLLRGEADAHRQVQLLLAADGIVHQVLEQFFVGGLAVDKALAGACLHGLLNQTLFVEAIAQALPAFVRVVAHALQQVVRAHELLEVGEYRVGFDQVFVRLRYGTTFRQALDAADGLAGQCRGLAYLRWLYVTDNGYVVGRRGKARQLGIRRCDRSNVVTARNGRQARHTQIRESPVR